VNTGAPQRIDAELESRRSDRLHVDHLFQIGDIRFDVVDLVHVFGLQRPFKRHPLDSLAAFSKNFVGPFGNAAGHPSSGRSAVGRIVLEPAVFGWIVGGRDDHTVGKALLFVPVERQNRV
jgi:hypothetical protein